MSSRTADGFTKKVLVRRCSLQIVPACLLSNCGVSAKGRLVMSTVEEIKFAISTLSREDYVRLREWFSDKDREQRDKETEGISASSKLSKKSESAEEARRFYASRIEILRNEAVTDKIPLNEASESDFWKFVRSASCIRKGSLFLRDNGNLRAVWSDDEGNRVGIQFFGDSAVQYVVFKRRADGEVWRDAQCDSLNNIGRMIEELDLEFLLHE